MGEIKPYLSPKGSLATFYFLDVIHDTGKYNGRLSRKFVSGKTICTQKCFAARGRETGWRTSCKKFLARNYGGGPGVTMESMADGDGVWALSCFEKI